MVNTLLLHIPRDDPTHHVEHATRALEPAHAHVAFQLARMPRSALPRSMRDLSSDEVLCAQTTGPLAPSVIRSLRFAVHHRFRDVAQTHRQLVCDLVGGDESRVRRKLWR
jgi:hypothetical protein